ncbi:hypothetical protein QNN03_34590 [Streptomyces sp. GXMU-J15]|uniref:Uncharacterized protein n=1 Tax=Streptomyces fuscus TaxID=3048495 RepID=A0ABT7J9L1_9ACTN|nr:hypothetical protein [Streptomyces fuscus]MDL2081571.1 hypothetical protein [Streptomyces fuscus]
MRHKGLPSELTPGDMVKITGGTWRVVQVEYRSRVVPVRVSGSQSVSEKEKTVAQADE